MHYLLGLNMGKGYFSYSLFGAGPEVRSDASKSGRFAGGGWVSQCGRYDFFSYGSRASRHLIDYLEGDVVTACAASMGHLWRGLRIPFGVDNMAFEASAVKGRSRVSRLNELVR